MDWGNKFCFVSVAELSLQMLTTGCHPKPERVGGTLVLPPECADKLPCTSIVQSRILQVVVMVNYLSSEEMRRLTSSLFEKCEPMLIRLQDIHPDTGKISTSTKSIVHSIA